MDQLMTYGNVTPSAAIAPEFAGLTHAGRKRAGNEDAFALLPEAGIALLADGIGGHARGELASALAISTALRGLLDTTPTLEATSLPPGQRLEDAFAAANRVVLDLAAADPGAEGMGTTLLAALFTGQRLHAAHVGDSRLYRLRADRLELLTLDQTVGQLLASRSGRPPDGRRAGPFSNVLTQAIGTDQSVQPEMLDHDCAPGDLFLLCSDGLHTMLDNEEIRLTLHNFGANLDGAARELIRLANESGGFDNITVVLARPYKPTEANSGERAVKQDNPPRGA
jgi:protein phosphatase